MQIVRLMVLSLVLAGQAGCSVNPATGEQSFTGFMSQSDEMSVGSEEHPKILKQFGGAYADSAVAHYIHDIGMRIVQVSEMPDLPFTFTVLNDEKVNAFALPGGYVYITRGIMALAENEAEVAGILAHEIGHVTARHSAQRYSRAQAANLGLTLLGVLGSVVGAPTGTGQLLSLGATAYIQGYSREQESEADTLGIRYLGRAGYQPGAMATMFRKLENDNRLRAELSGNPEAANQFSFLSSHPRTRDRIEHAVALTEGGAPPGKARVARDEYLSHIDGLLFGDSPEQGIRRGRTFLHPDLGIRFEVPPGFAMFNSPKQLVAKGPDHAAIGFDVLPARAVAGSKDLRALLAQHGSSGGDFRNIEAIDVNGMPGATGQARAKGGEVRLVLIREAPERVYRLIFLSPDGAGERWKEEFQRTTWSFRRLTPSERTAVRPLRIHITTTRPGDTVERLAATMPMEGFNLAWFTTLNDVEPGQPLVPGTRIKVIRE